MVAAAPLIYSVSHADRYFPSKRYGSDQYQTPAHRLKNNERVTLLQLCKLAKRTLWLGSFDKRSHPSVLTKYASASLRSEDVTDFNKHQKFQHCARKFLEGEGFAELDFGIT